MLQQPGHKNFKLSKIELIYKAKKFKVPPFSLSKESMGKQDRPNLPRPDLVILSQSDFRFLARSRRRPHVRYAAERFRASG